jgi:hypothetical protein
MEIESAMARLYGESDFRYDAKVPSESCTPCFDDSAEIRFLTA